MTESKEFMHLLQLEVGHFATMSPQLCGLKKASLGKVCWADCDERQLYILASVVILLLHSSLDFQRCKGENFIAGTIPHLDLCLARHFLISDFGAGASKDDSEPAQRG